MHTLHLQIAINIYRHMLNGIQTVYVHECSRCRRRWRGVCTFETNKFNYEISWICNFLRTDDGCVATTTVAQSHLTRSLTENVHILLKMATSQTRTTFTCDCNLFQFQTICQCACVSGVLSGGETEWDKFSISSIYLFKSPLLILFNVTTTTEMAAAGAAVMVMIFHLYACSITANVNCHKFSVPYFTLLLH